MGINIVPMNMGIDNYGTRSMGKKKPSRKKAKSENLLGGRCDILVSMELPPSPPESIFSTDLKTAGSWSLEDFISWEDGGITQHPNHNSTQDNSPVQRSSASRKSGAQAAISKRKSRGMASSWGSNSNSEDEGSSIKRQCHGSGEPRIFLLACPFYKRHPHRYQVCLSYQLRRIKDVKQHVYRKHSKPELYCARCFQVFSNAKDRDTHTRAAICEMHTDPQYDGITAQQKKDLAIYVTRGRRLEEQWYDTYGIIFPGETEPKSVFVGNYFEEVIPLLRAFWDTRQSGIISKVVEGGCFDGSVNQQSISTIINTIFDQFKDSIDGTAPEQEALSSVGQDSSHLETPRVSRRNSSHNDFFPECASPQTMSGEMVQVVAGQSGVEDIWPYDSAYPLANPFEPFLDEQSLGVGENCAFKNEN